MTEHEKHLKLLENLDDHSRILGFFIGAMVLVAVGAWIRSKLKGADR